MIQLVQRLERIGLSKKESKVYLATLELGQSGANAIARKARVPRATTYTVLRQLIDKGLVTFFVKEGEHRFGAEHPEKLIQLLQVQKSEIDSRVKMATDLMPRLIAFYNRKGAKPKIRYFEGLDGLDRLRHEFTDFDGDILQIVGYDTFVMLQDPQSTKDHLKDLKSSPRSVRSIMVTNRDVHISGHEIVCVPPELAPVEGEMTVLGDKVIMFSYSAGIIAIEITSATIAETVRASLEFAWRYAKSL